MVKVISLSGRSGIAPLASGPAKKYETLEALRGVAALLVVMFHLQDVFIRQTGVVPFGGLFGAGDRGVDLFFVLSGFIIMATHAKDIGVPANAMSYLYKRASRVFPSVWIATAFAAAVYGYQFGGLDKPVKFEPWNMVASLFLLPQTQPALVNVTWTLTYEILFYGLFALLIANRRLGLVLLVMWQCAVGLAAAGLLVPSHWLAAYYLRSICLEFGIGMLCALVVTRDHAGLLARKWLQLGLLVLGAGLFFGGMIHEGLSHRHAFEQARIVVYGLGPGLLILGLVAVERHSRLRLPAPVLWLGSISYAVYLVNFSVITLASIALLRLRPGPPDIAALLICAVLAVAAGGAFHAWVDQPIQQWLRRRGKRLFNRTPGPGSFVHSTHEAAAMPGGGTGR